MGVALGVALGEALGVALAVVAEVEVAEVLAAVWESAPAVVGSSV